MQGAGGTCMKKLQLKLSLQQGRAGRGGAGRGGAVWGGVGWGGAVWGGVGWGGAGWGGVGWGGVRGCTAAGILSKCQQQAGPCMPSPCVAPEPAAATAAIRAALQPLPAAAHLMPCMGRSAWIEPSIHRRCRPSSCAGASGARLCQGCKTGGEGQRQARGPDRFDHSKPYKP